MHHKFVPDPDLLAHDQSARKLDEKEQRCKRCMNQKASEIKAVYDSTAQKNAGGPSSTEVE